MTTPIPEIPSVFEGYSKLRVIWYGAGASLRVAESASTGSTEGIRNDDAAAGIKNTKGGIELSTYGESNIAGAAWNKDTSSPAGVLQLSLYPRENYLAMIAPDDVLAVYGTADKESVERFIAMCSVDSVNEARSVDSSGATILRVSVQARDLGKILAETPTVYDAAFGGLVMAEFFSQFTNAFTRGTAAGGPSVVVTTMLAIFFSLKQNFVTRAVGQQNLASDVPAETLGSGSSSPLKLWEFPGQPGLSLFSFIDTKRFVQTPMVGALLADASLLQNAANLWALCEMYANRLVNEFFIDTRDLLTGYDVAHKRMGYYAQKFLEQYDPTLTSSNDQKEAVASLYDAISLGGTTEEDFVFQPVANEDTESVIALVHRQLPYDTFSFYSLPTTIVFETEVFTSEVGQSSRDVYNMFRIRFPGVIEGVAQDQQFGVHINRESIAKHGLRRFEGESIYVWTNARDAAGGNYISSHFPTFEFYQSLVTTWYAYNERMKSGSMTIRFRPDIRCGTRLTFVKTSTRGELQVEDFYVQRVSHTYSPGPGASRTTVDLVRGIARDGLRVEADRESHLFWSNQGGSLNPDPYEVVISQDLVGKPPSVTVSPVDFTPGDE